MPRPPVLTLADAERFLYDRLNYERVGDPSAGRTSRYPFRLDRMRSLVRAAGYGDWLADEPTPSDKSTRRSRRVVHIAGTKGKGSTATILQSILTAAGHTVGTYTSPHLEHLTGRFRINGQPVTPESLIQTIDHLQSSIDRCQIDPDLDREVTFFELTTLAAIDLFVKHDCDVVILEVGLGGRLDSTNVFQTDVAAITSIGLDHQHILGGDHATIAAEKAGIIKPGQPVFSTARVDDAAAVIRRVAADRSARLQMIDRDWTVQSTRREDWGSDITVRHQITGRTITASLAIEGHHQAINASMAVVMADQIFGVDDSAITEGLSRPGPPARLERWTLPTGQTLILDSSHNADSVAALCRVLDHRAADRRRSFVFATSVDKDAAAMLSQILPRANRLFLTRFAKNPRAAEPSKLRGFCEGQSSGDASTIHVHCHDDAAEALNAAIESTPADGWIVICGSFFLAAELRPLCHNPVV